MKQYTMEYPTMVYPEVLQAGGSLVTFVVFMGYGTVLDVP